MSTNQCDNSDSEILKNSENAVRQATCTARNLSEEEIEKIQKQDCRLVSSFQACKLEENAQKYWDQFYNRNKTNFFKDRHWTTREFKELLGDIPNKTEKHIRMLEIGCGVGNLLFPLIEEKTEMEIYACDFSPRAIDFIKNHELYKDNKIYAFQADVTKNDLLDHLKKEMNLVTMVFVLSAIHPDKFVDCIKNVYKVLKPEGIVLFRDYGIYDMTQIRFKPGHKISDYFYMRQDGTRSYFFKIEELRNLFNECGFKEIDLCYIETRTVNKKEGIDVPRVFVQGKFMKKIS